MTKRAVTILLVVLAITSLGLTSAFAQSDVESRSADLTVRQESYVSEDVSVSSTDGTPVYTVRGERIWIDPQNFEEANVVDFGVDRGAGSLTHDSDLGLYTFSSEGEVATFAVYWIVAESVPAAGNNTNATDVHRVRYEATIKVAGQAELEHVEVGTTAERQEAAENWEEFNSTVQDIREEGMPLWFGDTPSTEAIVQGMITTYVTTRDPSRLLSQGLTAVILTLVLTVGGLLYLVLREGWAAYVLRSLRKQLHIYKSVEAEEGEVSDRLQQLDRREKLQALQNYDWQDMGFNDHESASYREIGENPRDGFENLLAELPPFVWLADRLGAMHDCGYRARILEGDDDVIDAEIVPPDDVDAIDEDLVDIVEAEQGNLVGLEEAEEDLLKAVCNDEQIYAFNLLTADYDVAEAFETSPPTLSLDEFVEQLPSQLDWFDDPVKIAQGMHEHIDAVAESSYCDPDGAPIPSRRTLNSWLRASQWLGDRLNIPAARIASQHIERMLIDHDPGREAEQLADDIREGKYA